MLSASWPPLARLEYAFANNLSTSAYSSTVSLGFCCLSIVEWVDLTGVDLLVNC